MSATTAPIATDAAPAAVAAPAASGNGMNIDSRLDMPLEQLIQQNKKERKGKKAGKGKGAKKPGKRNPNKKDGAMLTVGPSPAAKAKNLKKKNAQIKLVNAKGTLLGGIAANLNAQKKSKPQGNKAGGGRVVMPTAATANLSINLLPKRESFKARGNNGNNNAHAERVKAGQEKKKNKRENKANSKRGIKMEQ